MPAAENIAIARRVESLEAAYVRQDILYQKVTFVVCGRGTEPRFRTVKDVLKGTKSKRPSPPMAIERRPGPEVMMDPLTQVRVVRADLTPDRQTTFDQYKSLPTTRKVDVEIQCHASQLDAILSDAPITATFGGNRSGKSMTLIWWLFLRWLLRGGPGQTFWWVSPTREKAVEQGAWKILQYWPREVFVSTPHFPKNAISPTLALIDGSIISFQHAANDGDNLKSASVTDAVIDELAAIKKLDNYYQVLTRVSQQGGHVAIATTKKKYHWSTSEIAAREAEESIEIHNLDLFANPWLPLSHVWQLFLNDGTLDASKLESTILIHDSIEDQIGACRSLSMPARSLREHFGIETEEGLLLWGHWTGQEIVTENDLSAGLWITDPETHKGRKLINITSLWLAKHWPAAKGWDCWAGMDFNHFGRSVVMKLFGEGRTLEEAFANKASWHAIVTKEVDHKGTTLKHAEAIKKVAGNLPIYCDPTGAASGHDLRQTGGSTDVSVLRQAGYMVKPAIEGNYGQYVNLPFLSSANVMHTLMEQRKLRVHHSCSGVLDALKNDLASEDRRRKKTYGPNSESDKRSGFTDAIRYGLWPVFGWLVDGRPKAEIIT